MDARARWEQTWSHTPDQPPSGLLQELLAAYSEPHRAYHTVNHLSECFCQLDSCPIAARQPLAFELALWFHDAIYETKSPDNEEQSAAWALRSLRDLDPALLAVIEALILVTKHDAEPRSNDERLLLDIDLSILGAPPERFREYEAQIRFEYSWVPAEIFASARLKILRAFHERPLLYHTEYFCEKLESRARDNLQRSIDALAN